MNDMARDWISQTRGRSRKAGTAHDVGSLAAHVHNLVAKLEEPRRTRERLREEVAHVAFALDPGDANLKRLHHVAHEEVTPLNVLHATVVFGIVGDVACALLVGADFRGTVDGTGVDPEHEPAGGLRIGDEEPAHLVVAIVVEARRPPVEVAATTTGDDAVRGELGRPVEEGDLAEADLDA